MDIIHFTMSYHDLWLQQAIRLHPGEEAYFVEASNVLRTIKLQLPDVVVLEPVDTIEPLMDRSKFPFRVVAMSDFLVSPFQPPRYYNQELVEEGARRFADRPFPVLAWIWEEYMLKYMYTYLVDLVPHRLDMDLVLEFGTHMRDALVTHTWPNRYFSSAVTCPICFELTISNQARITTCKHVFCEECVLKWLEKHNTCPLCRAIIYWDL